MKAAVNASRETQGADTSVMTVPPDVGEAGVIGERRSREEDGEWEWLGRAKRRAYRLLLRQALPILLFLLTAGGISAVAVAAAVLGYLLGSWPCL